MPARSPALRQAEIGGRNGVAACDGTIGYTWESPGGVALQWKLGSGNSALASPAEWPQQWA